MDMFKNSGMSIHFFATKVLSQSLEKIKANNFTVQLCLIKIVLESFIWENLKEMKVINVFKKL